MTSFVVKNLKSFHSSSLNPSKNWMKSYVLFSIDGKTGPSSWVNKTFSCVGQKKKEPQWLTLYIGLLEHPCLEW